MDMLSVMPSSEKPADSINTSGKPDAAKSDDSVDEDNGIFSELLLMLSSSSGNNKVMPQNDESLFLSSRLNQSGELQNTQLLQFESVPLVRHTQSHNEDSREEMVITDTDAYKGSFDMDLFRHDLIKHLDNLPETTVDTMPEIIPHLVPEVTKENSNESALRNIHTDRTDIVSDFSERLVDLYQDMLVGQYQSENSGEQNTQLLQFESVPLVRHAQSHNEDSREERVIIDMSEDYLFSPGSDVSLPATGDTDAYKGSFDMNSFRDDFTKHLDNVPETTVDAMPEIMPNLVPEVTKNNSNESATTQIYSSRPDIVSDLSERLVDLYHIGGRSAKIRLQPEELGNLHIDISVVNDSINAIVTVEENSVKGIIDGNIDKLVEQLRRAGLEIDQFTVNISSSHYDEQIAGGWSDRNGRELFNDHIFSPRPVNEDTVLPEHDAKLLSAGAAGGISIFV